MADLRTVVTELGLVTTEWRGGVGHHFAAPKVLHDEAEIVLRKPGRDLVAVGRVGSQRYARAGREVLHRGLRYIVVDDVGKPDAGGFASPKKTHGPKGAAAHPLYIFV